MTKRTFANLLGASVLAAALFLVPGYAAMKTSGYKVIKTIPIEGPGGWDFVTVDSDARRIYISHATRVVVFDADTFAVVGTIEGTQGVHGIAIAPEFGRGFTSNGRTNDVTIFDLKTLKPIGTVKTGDNPDAITYDPVSKRIFTFNGRSSDATALNAADGTVVGTLKLGGKPEFAVADGKGSIFVNIEQTSELVQIDTQKIAEANRWPLKPCTAPSGLAMDVENRRLFAVCDEKVMVVVDADSGKVIANNAIGDEPDAAAFDPATRLVFSSNRDGTLTVVRQDSLNAYSVIDEVFTQKSAKTMGLDLKTHNIVLPAADFDAPRPGERRGKIKPGSLVLLVVGR